MQLRIRESPPVCFSISMARMITGRLRTSRKYIGQILRMYDGEEYTVFRHVQLYPDRESAAPITFIVRFRFSRLSHKANRIVSIIPMLFITGFPGFQIKIYGVNVANGYWQGMYQWESKQALEDYKQSLVYRLMNKRAAVGTVTTLELHDIRLPDFIEGNKV